MHPWNQQFLAGWTDAAIDIICAVALGFATVEIPTSPCWSPYKLGYRAGILAAFGRDSRSEAKPVDCGCVQ